MTLRIDLWSDFISPWCFLINAPIQQLQASHDVDVHWRVLSVQEIESPGAVTQAETAYPIFAALIKDQYGVELHAGPLDIDSHLALVGAKVAEAENSGERYREAVFRAYWQESRDISHPVILQNIAESVGLDRQTFAEALHNPLYTTQVTHDRLIARQYKLETLPALIFAGKFRLVGMHTYEALVSVVESLT
ncbi:MAG: DsbA family protein [Anaerolineae bacterium]